MKPNKLAIDRTAERGTDPDRLAEILSSSSSPVTVEPMGTGRLSFDCRVVTLGEMAFISAAYEGQMRNTRQAAGDKVLIVFPHQGVATIRGTSQDLVSAPGKGVIMDSAHNTGFNIFERRHHLVATLGHAELRSRLSNLLETSVSENFLFHPEIDLTSGPGFLLHQLADLMYRGLSSDTSPPPLALRNLSDAFFNLVLYSLPHSLSARLGAGVPTASPRHVKRAMDFMRAHLSDEITLEQIVIASGVSARSLQDGFRRFKGTSPMRYLRDLRLEAVHHELKHGAYVQTVSEIALAYGFVQLGRFAADYQARFAELPSQTLRAKY
ncbi:MULTISPECIES: AraC family transcriptional regulator [unclassified Rhizobium]|uniref:AraC family transcriptional regulator n=1 Tax=unclassified Rhizobium TaxID=2613769 RepID=UPI00247A4DA2|nr:MULTISPECIES: AraC family transcriptional regulator [unclassified Rhizobium]